MLEVIIAGRLSSFCHFFWKGLFSDNASLKVLHLFCNKRIFFSYLRSNKSHSALPHPTNDIKLQVQKKSYLSCCLHFAVLIIFKQGSEQSALLPCQITLEHCVGSCKTKTLTYDCVLSTQVEGLYRINQLLLAALGDRNFADLHTFEENSTFVWLNRYN